MEEKAHEAGSNDWIPNPDIPGDPLFLEPVKGSEVRGAVKRLE